MKQILSNIPTLGLCALLLTSAGACNKDQAFTKAVSIEIKGFNIGTAELEISVDTVVYRSSKTEANTELNFGKVFTYPAAKNEVTLKIKDLSSGKDVYQQQLTLKSDDLELFFPFVLIDGQQLAIQAPAADTATNKVGFYIYYPQSSDPIDVSMSNEEGEMVYLAKNVQPGRWGYGDYITPEGFQNASGDYRVYFTKAGTTDSWAFQDSEWMSMSYATGLALPQKDEKGRVCSYFITPGTVDLRAVRLFAIPE